MAPIDAVDLVSPGRGVVLPVPAEPGNGHPLEFTSLGRVRLRATANAHVVRPVPESQSLTVTVEHSDDGLTSWSTLATFSFDADGQDSQDVPKPKAHLRAAWAVDGGSWSAPTVVAVPLASTLPSLTEADGAVTLDAVLALAIVDAPDSPDAGWVVWADADGNVYAKDHAGTVRTLAAVAA